MITLTVLLAFAAPHELVVQAVPSPAAVAQFGGQAIAIDLHDGHGIEPGEAVRITDLPLADGTPVSLTLEAFDVFTTDARLVHATLGADGRIVEVDMPRPECVLLRGHVEGAPHSRVFLAVGAHTTNGVIEHAGDRHVIVRDNTEGWTAIYNMMDIDEASMHWVDVQCAVADMPQPMLDGNAAVRVMGECPQALRVAVDTDTQFTGLFNGDAFASAEYAMTLLGAVSSIYESDVDTAVMICYLRLWPNGDDPWETGSSSARLSEFQSHWNAQMTNVTRHLAHMLSGQGLGGGIAYVSVVCNPTSGYAVSGNLSGSFPMPIEDHHGNNWDLMVVAHELGHNCGTYHTHDYNPPIDGCGNGDCELAWGGTIMSYCHQCSGGLSNMVMSFHPQVQQTIETYLAGATCDLGGDGAPPQANVDNVWSYHGEVVEVDVLFNDWANDCSEVELVSVQPIGIHGGTAEVITAEPGSAVVRYTPPAEPVDIDGVQYTVRDGSGQFASAGMLIRMESARPPDAPSATLPGASVLYYELEQPTVLPDFTTLTPYSYEVVDDINFASTGGDFAGSGRHDDVGALFNGFVDVPSAGVWTFFVESDDGSRLWIGDTLIADNDGTHGMVEQGGDIALAPGLHAIQVEFFERGGGAGCIVRMAGPGMDKQVIPAALWRHDATLVGDLDGNGVVGLDDLLMLIAAEWGPCGPCTADLNRDGSIDISDVLLLIVNWSEEG